MQVSPSQKRVKSSIRMKNAFEYTASGQLMDDAKSYEMVRELRWPDGVRCPACDSGRSTSGDFTTTRRTPNGTAVRSVDDNSMT